MQKLRQVSSKSSQVDFLSRNGKSIVSFPAEASDFADVAEDLVLLSSIDLDLQRVRLQSKIAVPRPTMWDKGLCCSSGLPSLLQASSHPLIGG